MLAEFAPESRPAKTAIALDLRALFLFVKNS